jgi:hypothetical protein
VVVDRSHVDSTRERVRDRTASRLSPLVTHPLLRGLVESQESQLARYFDFVIEIISFRKRLVCIIFFLAFILALDPSSWSKSSCA